jgi:histone demethylase JARID1
MVWVCAVNMSPCRGKNWPLRTLCSSLITQADRHICVSYGSDVDTTKHGSGFSIKPDDPYSKFGWNLNVLPGLEGSILKHVSGISGISMPWLYVGMLFSTFCWHNEDNYLYSINYHHFGKPKLWYGVPGEDAEKLEECFRKHMPDEFDKNNLLLHDLVTMLSPKRLADYGVRVSRTVQEQREFVVTFPQAYHSGFSLGFNCGEAVNFAAADWIPHGRSSNFCQFRPPFFWHAGAPYRLALHTGSGAHCTAAASRGDLNSLEFDTT